MHKIALAIQKGGTAKTTSTLCLGGALTLQGHRVLLIDLDPQANLTSSLIDKTGLEEITTIYNVLTEENARLADAIVETSVGIDLVPSTMRLALAEMSLITAYNRERKLTTALEELEEELAAAGADAGYDFILMDCPPSLGVLTVNALAAADYVIVPLQTGQYALEGLNDFLTTVNGIKRGKVNSKLELLGILLTMCTNNRVSKDVVANVRSLMGDKVFRTQISSRAILAETGMKGPIQAYAPNSESSQEYNNLAQEVLEYVSAKR
ncbi:MAG TPA: ParA family protein [Chloroflexia bacterium]|nr:ParA family protein [Chloroflexia bacterium]